MAMREQDETPEIESESHSPNFLAKAAKMSKRKGGKRRVSAHHGAKKTVKRRERKRSYSKR